MTTIEDRARSIVVDYLQADPADVNKNASFVDDLGADSLDTIELVMGFEEEFGIMINDDDAETIQTFGDALVLIEREYNAAA